MQFSKIQNITDFIEMTMTERAEFLCKEISKDVKVSSGIYYIYNEECKLWKDYNADYFLTYMFKYLNKLSKSIKSITAGLKDKRVDKLISDFDNKNHVKDLIQRMEGDLQNEEIISNDYLPIKNNKKICLKDLTITERTKEDYFTFECNINLCEKTPNADNFFKQLMPKAKHREFLRKVLGYCLSGNTDARCFFVLYGKGSNGKSVIGRIMEAILLNYFVQCSEVFTWIIKGAVEYYKNPVVKMPEDWQERTTKILEGEDSIETFITRFIPKTDNDKDITRRKELFEKYQLFCNKNSQRCQHRSTLYNRLQHMNINSYTLDGYDIFRYLKCTFKKDDNTGNMFINNNKDDEYEKLNELYEKKDKQLEEALERLNKLENQIKEMNNILIKRTEVNNFHERLNSVRHNFDNLIEKMDKKYEQQINEVSMRVAQLEDNEMFSDDESDNNHESDEMIDPDESDLDESDQKEELIEGNEEDIEFEEYERNRKCENMFKKLEETKKEYVKIGEGIYEEKSTKKTYTKNDNDLEIHNNKCVDSFFNFA